MKDSEFNKASWKDAKPIHKEFVDVMYHDFGFKKHPGYSKLVFRPLIVNATAAPYLNTVFIDDGYKENTFKTYEEYIDFLFNITHGNAHILHFNINPALALKGFIHENYRLIEMVADLASLMFFKKTRTEEEFKGVQKYYDELDIGYKLASELLPYTTFDNGLLAKLTLADVPSAKNLVLKIIGDKHFEEFAPFEHDE